jgi:hypothetical protein
LEAVPGETPASAATSLMVAARSVVLSVSSRFPNDAAIEP